MKKILKKQHILGGPLLDSVTVTLPSNTNFTNYPFSLNMIKNLHRIDFPSQVTFFVGENGTGKSTVLEAIAYKSGFGSEGGNRHMQFASTNATIDLGIEKLSEHMKFSWRMSPLYGYFFKAESFFNIASYIDSIGSNKFYGMEGKSMHAQSHGETFLSVFKNALGEG